MPLTRTVEGLIYYDECESTSGWTYVHCWLIGGSYGNGLSTDKHSGIASLRCYISGSYGGNGRTGNIGKNKTINYGSGSGRRIHFWHKCTYSGLVLVSGLRVSNRSICSDHTGETLTLNLGDYSGAWARVNANVPDSLTGNRSTDIDFATAGAYPSNFDSKVDRIVICQSDNLIVSGLVPGQKVELYRSSDDVKLDTQTCQAGQTIVTFDISAEDFPLQLYCKIYATDGVTLIETTPSYEMIGGDTWNWTATGGTIVVAADATVIYRQAATGTPKTSNITATLNTVAGAPYPDATIYFSSTVGVCDPETDVTDADGEAHTQLTSTTHGLAIVEAKFLGDATVPACAGYMNIQVYYESEALQADSSKKFQVFINGYEIVYMRGRYAWNEAGEQEQFEIETPEWSDEIILNGHMSIYRWGVKDFMGLLNMPERQLPSRFLLKGLDISCLLATRIVPIKIYNAKTADYIINDLLTTYPCGISVGNINAHPDELTLTIDTEILRDAVRRIVDQVGWHIRINLDMTLDFGASFRGGTTATDFQEGVNIFRCQRRTDYSARANYIRMKGDGLYSTEQDGTKIKEQGVLEGVGFQIKISDQATLDLACESLLNLKKEALETIILEAKDDYAVGTFYPEDKIQVTAPSVGLSGWYSVKRVVRDLTDPYYARIELENRDVQWHMLDEAYRRMVKDASV